MKLLYITTKDFSRGMSDGVVKKIKSQIKSFVDSGIEVDYIYRDSKKKRMFIVKDGNEIEIGKFNKLPGVFTKVIIGKYLRNNLKTDDYQGCYIRFLGGRTDPWFLTILKCLKNANVKVFIEIPTYPYEMERKKDDLFIDRLFRPRLKQYVDRIVTFSEDKTIFGIKTINTKNGIEVEKITPVICESKDSNTINMIAVAAFAKAHGYERIIHSIYEYSKNPKEKKVILHMVGEGTELAYYKSLVQQYKIEESVIFYGKRFGSELDEIYNKSDIAIGCLGLYKKGVNTVSSLKTVEYVSKGLPVVNGFVEDLFSSNPQFVCEFDNDDSPINLCDILGWYEDLIKKYSSKEKLVESIRSFAFETADIKATMRPVMDCFAENIKNN